jgi:biotin transport system substrate-specific component
VSFLLAAAVAGAGAALVVRRADRRWWVPLLFVVAALTSVAVIHVLGVAGLVANLHLPLSAAVTADLPFLPGDLVKALVAAVAAAAVHRAFPDVLVRAGVPQRRA